MQTEPVRAAARIAAERVAVLLPLPLAGTYDYRVPDDLEVAPGQFVRVPLGSREVTGVAWGAAEGDIDPARLKDVYGVIDAPPLTEELRQTIDWTAAYTLSAPGAVLRMAMSVPEALDPPKVETVYVADREAIAHPPEGLRMTKARERLLAALAGGRHWRAADIARRAGVGAGVIKGLVETGLVRAVQIAAEPPLPAPDWRRPGPELTPAQAEAARALRAEIAGGAERGVTLLDGVTGSGKTEVYFEAIAAALARRRQVLVLLPEIALTVDWLQRFERRFGAAPAHWHSDLGRAERRRTWRAVVNGEARVVVGARSALFLPFRSLGLIVADEEHDTSFKQEDGVVYNARDIAIVRGRNAGCPVVLSSATPSLETVVNCERGRYRRIRLPERFGGAGLPRIAAIDMRAETPAPQSWISPRLREAAGEVLAAGEQVLFFLNRRGYAPLTLCRACGHRIECPQCSAWLVEHRLARRLQCHHCGYTAPPPKICPHCEATDSFVACGPGVERLAEEAAAAFPAARIAVMSSDTLRTAAAAEELVRRIQRREVDVVIGTQLVAKGHNFLHLTLVGVIDADLGLAGGDLRAAERTYQVLHQVAGRAGRADRPGRALLQTYDPDHPVIRALVSGDQDGFVAAEAAARRRLAMPPFGRLAAVVVAGRNEAAVEAASRALGRTAPRDPAIRVLGPAPAPLALIRGRHRRRLLVIAPLETRLQPVLRHWLRQVPQRNGVRIQVDVDPYSFL